MEAFLDFNHANMEVAFRLLASAACGLLIGAERELKGKVAGIKTTSLIAIGSCALMVTSIRVSEMQPAGVADPGRIAAQVVSGIGFIGAGAIIQARNVTLGVTTAATLWVAAAIGIVVGTGRIVYGFVITCLVLLILLSTRYVEGYLTKIGYRFCQFNLVLDSEKGSIDGLDRLLSQHIRKIHYREISRNGAEYQYNIAGQLSGKMLDRLVKSLRDVDGITRFHFSEDK